jgi:hypothetical protein
MKLYRWIKKFSRIFFCDAKPGSSVGIATELRAGRSGDRIPVGKRFVAYVKTGPGAHLASFTMGTGSLLGVNRPGSGADHPPHTSAEVENE